MPDYRSIDWTQERPDARQIEQGWDASRILVVDSGDAKLDPVVQSLQQTHSNGGALVAQFGLEVAPAIGWFLARNRLPEAGFFRRFFGHEHVRRRLGDFPAAETDQTDLGFKLESPFVAMGRLAQIVSSGGAYRHFEGPDSDVLTLVSDFTQAAFGNRYSETSAYLSWQPWSPWFKGIAWDASVFWLDLKTGTATVLLVTDTD